MCEGIYVCFTLDKNIAFSKPSVLAFVVTIYAKFWSNQYKRKGVGAGLHWMNQGLGNYRKKFYESTQQTKVRFAIQILCEDMLKTMHE